MPIPAVSGFMRSPMHTIGPEQTLAAAHRLMREHQIRHLPVLHGNQIIGIVSQRDLYLVETFRDANPDTITVEEAMSQDVVTVPPEARLDDVAELMTQRRLGSVVVGRQGQVEGIFTTTDALRAMVRVLRRAAT